MVWTYPTQVTCSSRRGDVIRRPGSLSAHQMDGSNSVLHDGPGDVSRLSIRRAAKF